MMYSDFTIGSIAKLQLQGDTIMSKGQDSKKTTKKEPAKTPKEKKAEKKIKKEERKK